jgi:XRE family aerobic/anaerobic benzoate catabolism transcriptional regulator
MPVNEVMAFYGQEGYRRLEAQALTRVIATHDSVILAVAGGIVSEPDAFKTLLAHFNTIWIKATPAEHMARVREQGDMRPMAGNPEAMDQLKFILTSREALYEQARAKLDTTGRSVEQSLDDLIAMINERGFLE